MVLAHDTSIGIRTSDIKITHDVTFDTMLLDERTLAGLKSAGFLKPSPIQLHGIPLGKCGFDLLLEAKSGTGKTAVFTVVALEKLELDKGLQAVILAPTREIAAQIHDVVKSVGDGYKGLSVEVVMGGLPVQEDIAKFKTAQRVHIVVGSPGRLRHLVQDKYIDTSNVRLLVLDEADKLVESSFQADINYIFSVLPKQKQVILSSATYPESSKAFISKYVDNSQHVCPDSTSVLIGISQKITTVIFNSNIVKQTRIRYEELLKLLTKKQFKQCLIFCNYQARVSELHKLLTRDKWPAEQLYGLQQQTDRLGALKTLQEYKCRILISTDLAARGIDASNVDLVVNFEPPFEWQTYLHRIGRAGRYGAYGTAVTIISLGKEEKKFKDMLAGMKDTINLNYLWSDSKYSLENPVPENFEQNKNELLQSDVVTSSHSLETNNNSIFKEIWEEISNTAESSNVIEDFENLHKSFEKCEIESFSNLIESFENDESHKHTQSSRSNKYNCISIKLDNIQIQNYSKHFMEKPKVHTTGHQFKENGTKHVPNKEVMNENTPYKIGAGANKSNHEHILKPKPINVSSIKMTNKKNFDEEHYEDIHDEETEMQRLGLPTSFWSKQDRKVQEKHRHKDENFTNKRNVNGQINFAKEKENKTTNHIVKEENELKLSCCRDENRNLRSINGKNKDIQAKCYSIKNSIQIKVNRELPAPNNHLKELPKAKTIKHKKGNDFASAAHFDYGQWFTQLKFRTQQIEMALYLDEISKF